MKKVGYSNFAGGPVIKTPPSQVVGVDSIPGWGAEIPCAAGCGQIFF